MPKSTYFTANLITKSTKAFCYFTILLSFPLSVWANSLNETELALLPEPVANNAVTQLSIENKDYLLSFSGLGKNKTYQDVHNMAFIYDVNLKKWQSIAAVPIETPINGLTGRLASVATSIKSKAYIFGGYTVAKDHSEVSVPDVYSYDVTNANYQKLASMPVPVDDSVALPYNNRYIYLVSGWHNDGNVNLVQLYDIETDT